MPIETRTSRITLSNAEERGRQATAWRDDEQGPPSPRLLRLPAVLNLTGLSRSALYVRVAQGLFPRQVSIGPKSVGWRAHEVEAVIEAWVAGEGPDAVKELVARLQASRPARTSLRRVQLLV